MKINLNRNLSSVARISTRISNYKSDERRARTQTLIHLGGLVSISGLLEYCDIQLGENLQSDIEVIERAAILLGIIYDAAQKALQEPDEHQKEKFRKLGISIMKQSAAKNAYLQKRVI